MGQGDQAAGVCCPTPTGLDRLDGESQIGDTLDEPLVVDGRKVGARLVERFAVQHVAAGLVDGAGVLPV